MRSLVWFRRALRLHDNPCLHAAIEDSQEVFLLYILNPKTLGKMSRNRLTFLYECLQDLDESLQKNFQNRLLVVQGDPLEILPSLLVKFGIHKLLADKESEPSGEEQEKALKPLLQNLSIQHKFFFSNTLYDHDRLLQAWGGAPPITFPEYISNVQAFGPPAPPLSMVCEIPRPREVLLEDYALPDPLKFGLKDYRLTPHEPYVPGGETAGVQQLSKTIGSPLWVKTFESSKSDPSTIFPSTSLLSPYFSLGALSPKLFHSQLHASYRELEQRTDDFSSTLFSQIHWREYFILLSYSYPNFDKIEGNPICRQLTWDDNEEFKKAYLSGQTGYPWIDACINQLIQHGWVHHLARHTLACFLTRGDLWLSWEVGRDFFERYLIDFDWSLCNANWVWMSGSGLDGQIMMVYNPVDFGKLYDPQGNFIRHFVPALKDFPAQYIYEPWKAPLEEQEKAGCVLGKDYPKRIIDHEVAIQVNALRLRACHQKFKGKPFPYGAPKCREEKKIPDIANKLESVKRKRKDAQQGSSSFTNSPKEQREEGANNSSQNWGPLGHQTSKASSHSTPSPALMDLSTSPSPSPENDQANGAAILASFSSPTFAELHLERGRELKKLRNEDQESSS